jgi:predicted Zn-dependent protease with MMP-like domain
MTDAEFDILITKAMNELPQEYINNLNNVAIVIADEPLDYQKQATKLGNSSLLLGLYEGIPLTKRGSNYNLVLPDKITLFKNSILALSHNEKDLFENIKRTLWHEIAHYYGLGHDDIDFIQNNKRK